MRRLMIAKQARHFLNEKSISLTDIANDRDSKERSMTLRSRASIQNDPNLTAEQKAFQRMILARSLHENP